MKTRNTQFLLVALMAFFLLAGNVNAEGTERKPASSLEIVEPALEIEAWMFNDNTYLSEAALYKTETEQALRMEDWMFNDNLRSESFMIEDEAEATLELQGWMLNETTAKSNEFNFSEDSETELEIESWMFNAII